jgi:hypothetical protein
VPARVVLPATAERDDLTAATIAGARVIVPELQRVE